MSRTAVYGEKLEFKLQQFIMTDSPAKTGRNLTNAIHILSKNWLMKSDYIKLSFLISHKTHTGFVDPEKLESGRIFADLCIAQAQTFHLNVFTERQ